MLYKRKAVRHKEMKRKVEDRLRVERNIRDRAM